MVSTPISPSRQNSVSTGSKTAYPGQLPPRRHLPRPDFDPLIQFLSQRLEPLVDCISGQIPADFPDTLLAYQLLTHKQLDNLACFFQQTAPATQETLFYPAPMQKPWIGTRAERGVALDTKRRRFGRFIGLRGCESPTVENCPFFEEPVQINFEAPSQPMDLDRQ